MEMGKMHGMHGNMKSNEEKMPLKP